MNKPYKHSRDKPYKTSKYAKDIKYSEAHKETERLVKEGKLEKIVTFEDGEKVVTDE